MNSPRPSRPKATPLQPSHILEGFTGDLVHRELPNVPHTIYGELWHLAFWQQITLDWIAGIETPTLTGPPTASPKTLHRS
jgi:hypothetical protein